MSCEICGYAYCNSSHSCPECARRRTPVNPMVKEHVAAGHQFGEAIIRFLAAFFLHPYLCLVGFSGLSYVGFILLAPIIGLVPSIEYLQNSPPWEVLPLWYTILSITLAVSVAVVFRKLIRQLMKWVLIIGVSALALWAVVAIIIYLSNR